MRLYWSHCGTYRLHRAEAMGVPPLTGVDGLAASGARSPRPRLHGLKTNIFLFDETPPTLYMPGFSDGIDLNPSNRVIGALREQLTALREGAGPEVDILLDLKFQFQDRGLSEGRPRPSTIWG